METIEPDTVTDLMGEALPFEDFCSINLVL